MRVLLSGGAGFIGSHVAEALLGRHHEVVIVDDLSSGKRENIPEGVHLYEADIRTGCAEIFEDFGPEVLCHQAAQMDVRRSVREPDFDADVNVLGTIRLRENCVEYGVGKVVFASTGGAVYGEQQRFPATEDHPQYPVSLYGVSKLACERYLYYYHAQYGLPYVTLRYSNVYGPRQDPHDQRHRRADPRLCVCRDVARANVLALEGEVPPGAYNVGTGSETSVNELYRLLLKISGKDLAPEHGPAKPGEQLRSSVDPTLAGLVMGWRPEVDLTSGLKETLRFFGAL